MNLQTMYHVHQIDDQSEAGRRKVFRQNKFRRKPERQTTTSKCRIVSFLYMF